MLKKIDILRMTMAAITRLLISLLLLSFNLEAISSPTADLTITGKISTVTDSASQSYRFTESDILSLPQHEIRTSTSWTPESVFVGPRLSDLLAIVGVKGFLLEIHTLDEYTYTIPISDTLKYGIILAHTMNLKRLEISDFGPLFLIYPRDQHPQTLFTPTAEAKFSWQINHIIVR